MKELINNIDKIHTTELGVERISKNLNISEDVVEYCKRYFATTSHPSRVAFEQSSNGVTVAPLILQFINLILSHFQAKSSDSIIESLITKFVQFLQALTLYMLQFVNSILLQYQIDALEVASKIVFNILIFVQCQMVYFKIIFVSSIVIFRHSLKALSPCSIPSIMIRLK